MVLSRGLSSVRTRNGGPETGIEPSRYSKVSSFFPRFPRVLLLLALFAFLAPAQHKDKKNALRDVQGTVTDQAGKPVAGAVVS